MSEIIDKEKLWKDIKRFVERRILENQTEMYTKSHRKRFWIKEVTNSYIRVQRENSNSDHEDIPKSDFIDIWKDLKNLKFSSEGYMIRDLQGGNNRHSSISFKLFSEMPYIETKEISHGKKYFLIKKKL